MKTYIKILKDNVLTVSINNIEIDIKNGDILVIIDDMNQIYYKGQKTDENEKHIHYIHYLYEQRYNKKQPLGYDESFQLFTEQEYRQTKLNILLDENIC